MKMLVLVVYDINTESSKGQKRLKSIAKMCERYGQRVQNSVFECIFDNSKFIRFKNDIEGLINKDEDSVSLYEIGNKYEGRITRIGKDNVTYKQDSILVI